MFRLCKIKPNTLQSPDRKKQRPGTGRVRNSLTYILAFFGCCESVAHNICCLPSDGVHTEKTFSHTGIYLSLTLGKLRTCSSELEVFVPFKIHVQNKREVYTCLLLNHGTLKIFWCSCCINIQGCVGHLMNSNVLHNRMQHFTVTVVSLYETRQCD